MGTAVVIPFPIARRDRARPVAPDAWAADLDAAMISASLSRGLLHGPAGLADATLEGKARAIGARHGLDHLDRERLVVLAHHFQNVGRDERDILERLEGRARLVAEQYPTSPGAA